jgi:hypothetical protein
VLALAPAAAAGAQPADDSVRVTFGAFVDGYYAYDAGRPPRRDRAFAGGAPFTTQPARHNEFNVNLAFAEARLEAPRYRGRLAVQFGTSVQANYAGEPRQGETSGPDVQQYLQEAVAGYRLARGLWVDGGIMFSNVGMESWASRDNLTYSRALVSEYSPYYSTGVKLTYAAGRRLTARLDVVNGWQNISESNEGKGVGLRLDYAPGGGATVSYYNLFSEEAGTRLRAFNGVGARLSAGPLALLGQADVGTQRRAPGERGRSAWYGLLGAARLRLSPAVAVAARAERFDDRDQVVLSTGARAAATPAGGPAPANPAFRGNGLSFGVDVSPGGPAGAPRLLWRTEVRGFRNREPVFPTAPRRRGGAAASPPRRSRSRSDGRAGAHRPERGGPPPRSGRALPAHERYAEVGPERGPARRTGREREAGAPVGERRAGVPGRAAGVRRVRAPGRALDEQAEERVAGVAVAHLLAGGEVGRRRAGEREQGVGRHLTRLHRVDARRLAVVGEPGGVRQQLAHGHGAARRERAGQVPGDRARRARRARRRPARARRPR